MAGKVESEPSDISNERGEVLVSGPDGVAVSMTPEAAIITGNRLIRNAAMAKEEQDAARDAARRALPAAEN
jgi:hypothetical protein